MTDLVIGIDLGTTNTVVAVAGPTDVVPEIVAIPQWLTANQLSQQQALPSVLFLRPQAESKTSLTSWDDEHWLSGEWARRRASDVPARAVLSAKSWLCHAGVDRSAKILPWLREDTNIAPETLVPAAQRISPVEASARLLKHVKLALAERYGARLVSARWVLTIPASFDPVARALTLQAARDVGLDVELLEEPQAAFYSAVLGLPKAQPRQAQAERVLVIDVGGGTTDLALFAAEKQGANINYARLAVGRHLLLGGDNIDLALAARIEAKLGDKLAGAELAALILAVREAKEQMLGVDPPASVPISIARRGAALVGNTWRSELTATELESLLHDGFLPFVELSADGLPPAPARSALRGFGLPFERDPAISRHIVEFIARKRAEFGEPDALLFNGGLFHSQQLRERVRVVLERALRRPLRVIPNAEPSSAVARGAVVYGRARGGAGSLIESASPYGYYVGLGGKHSGKAFCLVPRGAKESEVFRPNLELALVLGRAVRFDLFASDAQRSLVGEIVSVSDEAFLRLPSLSSKLDAGSERSGTETVPVKLSANLTTLGTLRVVAEQVGVADRVHALEFELRAEADLSETAAATAESVRTPASVAGLPQAAIELLLRIYGTGRSDVTARLVKDLPRDLEQVLGARATWSVPTLRELGDRLLEVARTRRRSKEHERVYFQLLGYALRPGFGALGDAERAARMGALFHEGLGFGDERKQWEAFLVAYRRVTAGLAEPQQDELRTCLDPFIAPSELKLKKPKQFRLQGEDDALWLAAGLERVSVERRKALGQWILERTWTSRKPHYWEMLGRIGARVPLYASAHFVIEPRAIERWIEHLLSENWSTLEAAPAVAARLARYTDDRARDLSSAVRKEIASRLQKCGAAHLGTLVLEYVPVAAAERVAALTEDLPPGLTLAD